MASSETNVRAQAEAFKPQFTACGCGGGGEAHWVLPVRVIRSFEYRTSRTLVLKDVCPKVSTEAFIDRLRKEMASSKLIPKTFLKHDFNCVKILHKPHMFKTSNPVINLDNDDWILPEDTVLDQFGLVNETELTFFNRADYEQYKLNPVHKTT
eukprot:scpid6678/ scgid2580/ UPF0538 protein C2orf76 homolog